MKYDGRYYSFIKVENFLDEALSSLYAASDGATYGAVPLPCEDSKAIEEAIALLKKVLMNTQAVTGQYK